jgi:hypothetical protein
MFNSMPKHECDVIARDGTIRASATKGIFAPTKIILLDPKIVIEPGDEIRRRLPNGTDETFEILDFHFVDQLHSLPSHYQVSIRRKGTYPHGTGGHLINITGNNSRVNIGSHVFASLSAKLESNVKDRAELDKILAAVSEMKKQQGESGFATAYKNFIAISADHLGVVVPFLPALTQFIRG